jgi:ATP-dependent Clp protease ATP-binding subunit ClpA
MKERPVYTTLRNKIKDTRTIAALCTEAERIAGTDGCEAPGSEHFVLAALAMPDGTARHALARLGATPQSFEEAIRAQFAVALGHIGMDAPAGGDLAGPRVARPPAPSRVYRAAPSGQSLVQRLSATAAGRKDRSLLAADVLLAAAQQQYSIAARAFGVLGITPQQLVEAASREIAHHAHGHNGAEDRS